MKNNFQVYHFFACQVMGIMGSQIETKKIFSTVRVIVGLQHCRFGIENLDKLVPSMKNKLDDPSQLGCSNCYKFIDERTSLMLMGHLGFTDAQRGRIHPTKTLNPKTLQNFQNGSYIQNNFRNLGEIISYPCLTLNQPCDFPKKNG